MDVEELADEMQAEEDSRLSVAPVDITGLLDRVAEMRARKEVLEGEAKRLSADIKTLEGRAIEQLQLLGLRGCKTDTRTWYVSETVNISVPKDKRDAVLAAAAGIMDEEGNSMADEIRSVMTQTLKAWLTEQHRNAEGKAQDAPLAAGTVFEGLVTEYRAVRLGSTKRG